MTRKSHNFRRGDGGGGGGHRRFGGTGSLGNYNRGAGRHDGHDNNRPSGSFGDGGNFNRSYDNANSAPPDNKDYDRFQKFRDPHAYEQRNNNMRSQHDGRRSNYGRRGGKQNYGNETRRDGVNWYEDHRGTKPLPAEQQQQGEMMQPPQEPQEKSSDYPAAAISPAHVSTSPPMKPQTQNSSTKEPELSELEQTSILKNIKQERIAKEVSKQIIKPPPTSSSSSSSSDSSDSESAAPSKTVQVVAKDKVIKKEEAVPKPTKKIVNPPTSPSSSSSSEEEEESDHKTSKAAFETPTENTKKSTKKSAKKKQSSEEDLICLGKLEKKFVIEDDASEEANELRQTDSSSAKNCCMICDKQGHTAFECQMICKNCSASYHNMKSCPKPANLSIVMQSFMEFCMGQMNQFNPEQKFILPAYLSANENKLIKETLVTANKKGKKANIKSKEPTKRLIKGKRKRVAKSSDEEEDDDEEEEVNKNETEEEPSSESESESDTSEEVVVPKSKKKRTKAPAPAVDAEFPNTFIPPFSTFPTFGAAAAAYNPLLLSQLMHGGSFGTPKKLNFQ